MQWRRSGDQSLFLMFFILSSDFNQIDDSWFIVVSDVYVVCLCVGLGVFLLMYLVIVEEHLIVLWSVRELLKKGE